MSVGMKLFLSLVLGAVIGLERESYEDKINKTPRSGVGSLGVRTFSLITTLGAIAGLLYFSHFSIYILIITIFGLILTAYYIIGSFFTHDNGITTELAIFLSFLFGLFISLGIFPTQLIIAMVIVLVSIMSIKEKLHTLVEGIKDNELGAFISYAIIALVVLPFLPDRTFSFADIPNLSTLLTSVRIDINDLINLPLFNPFNIWKVVVIVTGVDILGYFLEKTVGRKRGWMFASLAGGFISSTSTTQSLALKSKNSKDINKLTAGAVFASFSSFLQHSLLIITVNGVFFTKSLLYIFSILVSSLLIGFYFLSKEDKNNESSPLETEENLNDTKIFSLGPL